ncbi:MAG: hypothetical protein IH899_18875 [Planctomycetes bacterium]|nr:hypothetical protein [Planctomycetota bacterium]
MGAAPVLLSVVQKSYFTARPLRGFWVRNERKAHGMQQKIDGDPGAGDKIIVVDDVTTTGGSVLKAVDAMQDRGCDIVGVLTIVQNHFSQYFMQMSRECCPGLIHRPRRFRS